MLIKYIANLLFTLFLFQLSTHAQLEPAQVTRKYFPEPDIIIPTPAFAKDRGFTTHSEMIEFLKRIADKHSELIQCEIAGCTQRGLDIPLITIKNGNKKNKIKLFYFAGVHGNESAGIETLLYFIERMAGDPSLRYFLNKLEFYVLPMLNGDGVSDFTRLSANGININRDMVTLNTPEATVLHEIVNKVQPHVIVDFHEYGPYHERYSALSSTKMMIPWDVMFLFSSNPNVTTELRDIVADPFLSNAMTEMEKYGLTHHIYYASSLTPQGISFMSGNNSPVYTVTNFALRNAISLLIETRGIGLERTSLKRRIFAAHLLATRVAKTSYDNIHLVLNILAKSEKSKGDIVTNYSTEKTKIELPFINASDNEIEKIIVNADLAYRTTPNKKQYMPQAYLLLPEQVKVVELLKKMGTEVIVLEKETTIKVQCFAVQSLEQTNPVSEKSIIFNAIDTVVNFPSGTHCIPTNQKNIRLLSVLLEPESTDGWVHQGIIDVKINKELPIYKKYTD